MPTVLDQPQGILSQPAPQGGLLSFISSPMGQGLLSAAFTGLASAGRPGMGRLNTLGAAGLGGLQGYSGAQENQRQAAFDEQRKSLMTAQLAGLNTQNENQQFDLGQKRKRMSYWENLQQPGAGLPQLPAPGETSAVPSIGTPQPSPGNPALPQGQAQALRPDPMALLQNGYSVEEARALSDMPNWGAPEITRYVEVPDAQGKLEMVGLDKHGRRVNTGVNPWTAPVWQDRGGSVSAVDPVSLKDLRTVRKTMSPGEIAADQRARERLRHEQSQPKGQLVQTDQGFMLVDPYSGRAQPTTDAAGNPLQPRLKDIPGHVNTAIMGNAQSLSKVQQAIDLLDGKDVGQLKGDKAATGWKGYAPQAMLNRMDPDGVDTRAMISDIGSLVIHDRSGAAVTAAESPRLLPFIPLATDDAATARKKLVRFKQLYEQEQNAMQETYSRDQGYRTPGNRANPAPPQNRPPLDTFNANGGKRPPLSSFEGK